MRVKETNRAVMLNSASPATRIAYNFVQISESETEIEIYDVIRNKKSYDWWTDKEGNEVTPSDFKEQLDSITTPNVTIRMNSGGGEVNAANVIAVAIQEAIQRGKNITCKIDGVCASAAVQIATSCKEVIMHKSALLMIHNPMSGLLGYYDVQELKKVINSLEATKNAIMNYYEEKTGLTRQKLSNMMDAETWMDGKEAVEKGFADKLMFDEEMEEESVLNNIREICVAQAFEIPENYRTAINKLPLQGKEGNAEMEIKNVADLKEKYPALVDEIKAEVKNEIAEDLRNEGAETERARIKAIDEMQGKVDEALLNKAKYETFESAEKVAVDAIKNNAFVQNGVLNAMVQETATANGVKGLNNEPVDNQVDESKQASKYAEDYLKSIGKVE